LLYLFYSDFTLFCFRYNLLIEPSRWYRAEATISGVELVGWIGSPNALTQLTGCVQLLPLDSTGMPLQAQYDYPLPPPPADNSWLSLPCSANALGTANWINCARIVYHVHYNEFVRLLGRPPMMSELVAAVFQNELSALPAAGAPSSGINRRNAVDVADITREAVRSNYWSVVNEHTDCGIEPPVPCNFEMTAEQITEHYLVQVQSYYQLADAGDPDIGDIVSELIEEPVLFSFVGYESVNNRWQVDERLRQWGNYGFGRAGYMTRNDNQLYTNLGVGYCYTIWEFDPLKSILDIADSPVFGVDGTWNDYRFVITFGPLGIGTSTYDPNIARPSWVNNKIERDRVINSTSSALNQDCE